MYCIGRRFRLYFRRFFWVAHRYTHTHTRIHDASVEDVVQQIFAFYLPPSVLIQYFPLLLHHYYDFDFIHTHTYLDEYCIS